MEELHKKEGVFSWYELMTTDVKGAKKFYGELFGWEFTTDTSTGKNYTMANLKNSNIPIAGILDKKDIIIENKDIPPHWGCYITVYDIKSSVSKVQTLGGNIIVPPTDIPNIGKFAVIQDPAGAVISLFEYLEN